MNISLPELSLVLLVGPSVPVSPLLLESTFCQRRLSLRIPVARLLQIMKTINLLLEMPSTFCTRLCGSGSLGVA